MRHFRQVLKLNVTQLECEVVVTLIVLSKINLIVRRIHDFVCVLGGTEDRPPKPDTAIIVDILSRLPDEKNQVFMIGDSNVDIQTGHNAGIETIGCAWGFRGREELEREGADYIAEAPADIVGFVTGKKDQA